MNFSCGRCELHSAMAFEESSLMKRCWSFVGPTTIYAFMQAMGLVNDHVDDCAFK
jgi:3-methyladenine DNA glycosylase Tag